MSKATVTTHEATRQVVIESDNGSACVSISPSGKLVSVDDNNTGANKYIGYDGDRAQKATEEILKGK